MLQDGKICWGVIGACGIARRRTIPEGIIPASNAVLRCIADTNSCELDKFFDELRQNNPGMAQQLLKASSIDGLLSLCSVDAIYVATPNHLHRDHVIAAAKAGKHVLCEKPLANNSAHILSMIEACRQSKVLLGVGFMMRFNPYHIAIRDMIRNGNLGVPVLVRGQMTCWYPPIEGAWRQNFKMGGGGAMVDMGSHVIDVMEQFFGRVEEVAAFETNRKHTYPVEDTCVAILKFESGVVGTLDVSFAVPDEASEFALEVYGSKGAIKGNYSLAQGPGGNFRVSIQGGMKDYDAQQAVETKGGFMPWVLEPKNTYQSEIEAFSQAILDGATEAPVPAEDGLHNHQVIQAIYESTTSAEVLVV